MGRPTVLVVVPSRTVAEAVIPWLHSQDCELVVVDTFARAKRHLELQPDLLITEVRLGEYNGLHLVLRGQFAGVPAIVIGEPDPVLEHDANKLGAVYIRNTEMARDQLLALLTTVLQSHPKPHGGLTDLAWIDRTDWQQHSDSRSTTVSPGKNWTLYH